MLTAVHFVIVLVLWLIDGWLLERTIATTAEAVGAETAALFHYSGGHPVTNWAAAILSLPFALFVGLPWNTAGLLSRLVAVAAYLANSLLWGVGLSTAIEWFKGRRRAV